MFQNVLLFELSHKNVLILLFSSKSVQKFSRKNVPVQRKAYCPLTAPGGGQYAFSGPLSNQSAYAIT